MLLLALALGSALAVADRALERRIAHNSQARLERAVLEVVPAGVASRPATLDGRAVHRVLDGSGRLVGWAVPAETVGFQDRIRLLVGISPDGKTILGLAVLQSTETPGLGERIREADFRDQFIGKSTGEPLEAVKPGQTAGQPIDAISGATISSNAVVRAVNEQLAWIRAALPRAAATPPETRDDA